jgi:nucleoside-diphosphate-sugar epimerase
MKIFITGINGYLGSSMARSFARHGHEVVGSKRQVSKTLGTEVSSLDLGSPFSKTVFEGADLVIHCAHDFSKDGHNRNVEGTQAWFEAAKEVGVSRQIFLSSYSARPDALSDYGQIKFKLENVFLSEGETILRPGLVIGLGGLFGRNMEKLLRSRIVPLPNSGRDLLPVISIGDFLEATERIVRGLPAGAYNLFNSQLVTLNEIVRVLNQQAGRRVFIFPVPISIALLVLETLSRVGVSVSVDVGNLRSLRKNQKQIHRSDLQELIGREDTVGRMLAGAYSDYLEQISSERFPR